MKGPLFYSKILLFGEYGIIKDSKGLSIPYNFYNGALKIDSDLSEVQQKSNNNLKRFSNYLAELQTSNPNLVQFNLEELTKDKKDSNMITGLTISPKRSFSIIKIWNNNKNKNKSTLLNKVNNLSFDSCIYKAHNV